MALAERAAGRRRALHVCLCAAAVTAAVISTRVTVRWTGAHAGLFLLRGEGGAGAPFEIADDLVVGDEYRLVGARALARATPRAGGMPRLEVDWDAAGGGGVVVSHQADGSRTATFFGRYRDTASGARVRGLFVGGAPADVVASEDLLRWNESGMALFERGSWFHLWCSVNEGIAPAGTERFVAPAQWRFLGSRVVSADARRAVLESLHALELDGVPLRIERRAIFQAGDASFHLDLRIRNEGVREVAYRYLYADDPWVGHYGSADTNSGWLAEGLEERERTLSARNRTFAGMADGTTGLAVFLEWQGDRPDLLFFANRAAPPGRGAGMLGDDSNYVGLQWTERHLAPGATADMGLAIGWARTNPATGIPEKPPVRRSRQAVARFLPTDDSAP